MDIILVFDFGGQTSQLIARRIRELGVFSKIVSGNTIVNLDPLEKVKGIVLSGSPYSVYDSAAPTPDHSLFDYGVPILGICYGMQYLVKLNGGEVSRSRTSEYGQANVTHYQQSRLFDSIPSTISSWMSHGDSVKKIPAGFKQIASSEFGEISAVETTCQENGSELYGLQFHPEVSHTEYGLKILENFSLNICRAMKMWSAEKVKNNKIDQIRQVVGSRKVILLISGGVDSTVLAALLLKALKSSDVYLLYVDTGFMRSNETSEVRETLKLLGAKNIQIVDAAALFYKSLRGVTDPEEKRKLIGDLFVEIQNKQLSHLSDAFLAQGTLYTDMIESGKGVGGNADLIKSHHNVASPLIQERRENGLLLEPLCDLYKDEVKRLGLSIGVREDVIYRHPFPGPGLAVRIIGEVTKEKCDLLRQVDAIYIKKLHEKNLYKAVTQAFAVLLPVNSVGVVGDQRSYGAVVALRAVVTDDFMTAQAYPFDMQQIFEIASTITNEISSIGRVVYDISSKPPATVEWE